jgi:hypothetical protein
MDGTGSGYDPVVSLAPSEKELLISATRLLVRYLVD